MALLKTLALSLAVTMGLAPAAMATDAPSCGELPCRSNGMAYVSEAGGIVIMPGEAFSAELKIEDGKITGVVPRRRQRELANSVELDFGRWEFGLRLILTSHVNATVKVEGYMKLANGRFLRTSMCPLRANKSVFEMWPDRIEFLELRNVRIVAEEGAMACD